MADEKTTKESKVEGLKNASRHLRGTIAERLADDSTTHFEEGDAQLLKFHGSYQQDDRDLRRDLRAAGEEKAYQFMVRVAIPAGVLTAEQYLALDTLADQYANGTLRVTTRQGIQFHGVLKRDLKAHLKSINDALLTTLAACGDVKRNVMGCSIPLDDEVYRVVRERAREIALALQPASRAYHEIWLDGEKQISTEEREPFYGDSYLPRKFKIGITVAGDATVDLYSYDCGLMAIVEDGRIAGYNVLVGGGMGMTHNKADTFARLASELGFVSPKHAVDTATTVGAIFRDYGNRADRRHARLKYVIEERGIEWFRDEFRKRADFTLEPWRPAPPLRYHDFVGKHPQGGNRFFYGLFVENGRIADREGHRVKSALQAIVIKHDTGVVLTPNQNVLLTGLSEEAGADIEKILTENGVALPTALSAARRYSMACPALPTCGLAMAESERLMPSIVDRFESELSTLGLRDVPITLRMTGCPNGCARPYTADIAFVGRAPDVYNIHVGGGLAGDRLADLYARDVATDDLVATLRPLLTAWATKRRTDEGLSDFYQRHIQRDAPRHLITGKEDPTRELVQLEIAS
jgi:sulfite reductase beta subunit-like hemoprotein